MEPSFASGRSTRAGVVNENEVRAAAGLTMAIGAVAFADAYFAKQYVPLQAAASLFFVEFVIRVTAGLRYSPVGVLARAMTLGRSPEWVSAKPKRIAWTLGLVMALAMTVITNSGIRGPLPRTMCLICLTLMWMESALGLCLGCRIYGLLLRRGWIGTDPDIEVCADGSCELEAQPVRTTAATRVSPASGGASGVLIVALAVATLLVCASPAVAAAPDGAPVRFWNLSKIDRSAGVVTLSAAGSTGKFVLRELDELGPAPFAFPETHRSAVAIDRVFSSFDGTSFTTLTQSPTSNLTDAHVPRGGITHLDELAACRRRSPDATLRISIAQAILRAIDERRDAPACPPKTVSDCPLLRAVVLFRARAYANSVGGDFFTEGASRTSGPPRALDSQRRDGRRLPHAAVGQLQLPPERRPGAAHRRTARSGGADGSAGLRARERALRRPRHPGVRGDQRSRRRVDVDGLHQ